MADSLSLRKSLKNKKPTFVRSDAGKKIRIGMKWRRPKGLQSKVRLQKKGHIRRVKVGWGSPKDVKGLNKDGIKEIYVSNIQEISLIENKEKEGIVIKSTVGTRKKVEIIKKATEMKILILNVKNPQEFVKKIEDDIMKKKQQKEQKQEEQKKKEQKKKEQAKKKEQEEKKEEAKNDLTDKVEEEEKKVQEKKKKDKILTKKDAL